MELFPTHSDTPATQDRPALTVGVEVLAAPDSPGGSRIVRWGPPGSPLDSHLADVEDAVRRAIDDPRKQLQAAAMPTLLVIDVARTGKGWMRPEDVWAQRLVELLPSSSPFIALGVIIPRLDSDEPPWGLAVRETVPPHDRAVLAKLTGALGLTPTP
jgi:hypothetical protein